jgi:hypothetical protein
MIPVNWDIQALNVRNIMPIQPDRLSACAIANIPVPATTHLFKDA